MRSSTDVGTASPVTHDNTRGGGTPIVNGDAKAMWAGSVLFSGAATLLAWWNYRLDWWWLILIAMIVFAVFWLAVMVWVWIEE